MIIRIKNLRLRTIIGINEWERNKPQDVVINAKIEFDGEKAGQNDDIRDTLNYKAITKSIIELVEASEYFLLEKLAAAILDLIMQDGRVEQARVEVDKPHALRFADSVSVETRSERGQ